MAQSQGWIGFDRFMAMALYAPGMGYYSGGLPKLGSTPQGGSDFVTAPELSPWFGRTLARSVAEAYHAQREKLGCPGCKAATQEAA